MRFQEVLQRTAPVLLFELYICVYELGVLQSHCVTFICLKSRLFLIRTQFYFKFGTFLCEQYSLKISRAEKKTREIYTGSTNQNGKSSGNSGSSGRGGGGG